MPLIECMECNQPVSIQAKSCPGCKTAYPLGVPCNLCGRRLAFSRARHVQRRHQSATSLFHKECWDRLLASELELTCSACGKPGHCLLRACCNCGYPIAQDQIEIFRRWCFFCGLPIRNGTEIYLGYADGLESSYRAYAHNLCHVLHPGAALRSFPCLVVTALCGRESSEVFGLRYFRDTVLLSSRLGRSLIELYNICSPLLVTVLEKWMPLRTFVRAIFIRPLAVLAIWYAMKFKEPFPERRRFIGKDA